MLAVGRAVPRGRALAAAPAPSAPAATAFAALLAAAFGRRGGCLALGCVLQRSRFLVAASAAAALALAGWPVGRLSLAALALGRLTIGRLPLAATFAAAIAFSARLG